MFDKKNQKVAPVRQGDISIDPVEIAGVPAGAVRKDMEESNGKMLFVLARGEETNHNHVIEATEGVELYTLPKDYLEKNGLLPGTMLLKVAKPTFVVHDVPAGQRADHTPDPLAVGTYYVVGQREYAPEAPRRVWD